MQYLKITLLSLPLLAVTPAFAQQPPRQDLQVMVYRQLLDSANAQLAQTVATYETKIADLNAQIKKLTDDKKAPGPVQPGSTSK